MDIEAAFASKYLKASDLEERSITVKIDRVEMESLGKESKPVVYFIGKAKGVVLNKTNSGRIKDLYGRDTNKWHDKPITIYPSETDFEGKTVPCIRMRAPPATNGRAMPSGPSSDGDQVPNGPKFEKYRETAQRTQPPPADMDDDIPF